MEIDVQPIPQDILQSRIERAQALADERGFSALVLCSASRSGGAGQSGGNTAYFLGYTTWSGHTTLVIPREGRPVVIGPGSNERRMLIARVSEIAEVRQAADIGAGLVAALGELGIREDEPIGIAGRLDMPVRYERSVASRLPRLIDIDGAVHGLRAVVAPQDVALQRRASEISDIMIGRAMEAAIEKGMTPARLMAEVEYAGRSLGAESAKLWLAVGRNPVVTSFEFFELPETIEPGDRVQLGTTVCHEGHFTQGLRMGILGEPSAELVEADRTLLAIQDAALAVMGPGRPAHVVSDVLEGLIDANCPYTRQTDPFRFQSCHQLGLDYSDAPLFAALNASRDRYGDARGPLLREGQVIEIHPNYNLPGIGHVCAGDAALVTATGAEWLTKYPRGLVILK
jgi:Xaa-Pro aminopeptidase